MQGKDGFVVSSFKSIYNGIKKKIKKFSNQISSELDEFPKSGWYGANALKINNDEIVPVYRYDITEVVNEKGKQTVRVRFFLHLRHGRSYYKEIYNKDYSVNLFNRKGKRVIINEHLYNCLKALANRDHPVSKLLKSEHNYSKIVTTDEEAIDIV